MPIYELKECTAVYVLDVIDYDEEFKRSGETCKVLGRAHTIGFAQWYREMKEDRHTIHVCFFVNNELAGIGRVTPEPIHLANGNLGYGLRPSFRNKGYAVVMLRMMEEFCVSLGMDRITACVEAGNAPSVAALQKAGYVCTGTIYDWIGGRKAIEMVLAARR